MYSHKTDGRSFKTVRSPAPKQPFFPWCGILAAGITECELLSSCELRLADAVMSTASVCHMLPLKLLTPLARPLLTTLRASHRASELPLLTLPRPAGALFFQS